MLQTSQILVFTFHILDEKGSHITLPEINSDIYFAISKKVFQHYCYEVGGSLNLISYIKNCDFFPQFIYLLRKNNVMFI